MKTELALTEGMNSTKRMMLASESRMQTKLTSDKYSGNFAKHLCAKVVNRRYIQEHGLQGPVLVIEKSGLDLRVPSKNISASDIAKYAGPACSADILGADPGQPQTTTTLGDWSCSCSVAAVEGPDSPVAQALPSAVRIEISHTPMSRHVEAPRLVRQLDWVDCAWPKQLRSRSNNSGAAADVVAYPKVQKYCIIVRKSCYVDYTIGAGGSSTWFHVVRGQITFWLLPPLDRNLQLFEEWLSSDKKSEIFLGDKVEECQRLHLACGSTLFIPSGWIYAMFLVEDMIAFHGSFLHSFAVSMQHRVWEMECRVQKMEPKYPFFEQIHWYVLERYVHLRTGQSYLSAAADADENSRAAAPASSAPRGSSGWHHHCPMAERERKAIQEVVQWLSSRRSSSGVPSMLANAKGLLRAAQELLSKLDKDARANVGTANAGRDNTYTGQLFVLRWSEDDEDEDSCKCHPAAENGLSLLHVLAETAAQSQRPSHASGGDDIRPRSAGGATPAAGSPLSISTRVAGAGSNSALRKNGCGKCEACLRDNCGECPYCKDMPKYGGTGRMKQACLKRRCATLAHGRLGQDFAFADQKDSRSPASVPSPPGQEDKHKKESGRDNGFVHVPINGLANGRGVLKEVRKIDFDDDVDEADDVKDGLKKRPGRRAPKPHHKHCQCCSTGSDERGGGDNVSKDVKTKLSPSDVGHKVVVLPNCGECVACKDMKQFGGAGKMKKACMKRRDTMSTPQGNPLDAGDSPSTREAAAKPSLPSSSSLKSARNNKDGVVAAIAVKQETPISADCVASTPTSGKREADIPTAAAATAGKPATKQTDNPGNLKSKLEQASTPQLKLTKQNDPGKNDPGNLKSKLEQASTPQLKRKLEPEKGCKCDGCTSPSYCGHCVACKDMKRFGGPGKMKKACMNRRCHVLVQSGSSAGVNSSGALPLVRQVPVKSASAMTPVELLGLHRSNSNGESTPKHLKLSSKLSAEDKDRPCRSGKGQICRQLCCASPSSIQKRKAALERCHNCDGCKRSNCGRCLYCKDMKKFGGPGRMRKACTHRRCVVHTVSTKETTPTLRPTPQQQSTVFSVTVSSAPERVTAETRSGGGASDKRGQAASVSMRVKKVGLLSKKLQASKVMWAKSVPWPWKTTAQERCLKCDGCKKRNCGKCLRCKDMKQFGGAGRLKKACLNRQCTGVITSKKTLRGSSSSEGRAAASTASVSTRSESSQKSQLLTSKKELQSSRKSSTLSLQNSSADKNLCVAHNTARTTAGKQQAQHDSGAALNATLSRRGIALKTDQKKNGNWRELLAHASDDGSVLPADPHPRSGGTAAPRTRRCTEETVNGEREAVDVLLNLAGHASNTLTAAAASTNPSTASSGAALRRSSLGSKLLLGLKPSNRDTGIFIPSSEQEAAHNLSEGAASAAGPLAGQTQASFATPLGINEEQDSAHPTASTCSVGPSPAAPPHASALGPSGAPPPLPVVLPAIELLASPHKSDASPVKPWPSMSDALGNCSLQTKRHLPPDAESDDAPQAKRHSPDSASDGSPQAKSQRPHRVGKGMPCRRQCSCCTDTAKVATTHSAMAVPSASEGCGVKAGATAQPRESPVHLSRGQQFQAEHIGAVAWTNCGECVSCKDMKRFGGSGKMKKACVNRRPSLVTVATPCKPDKAGKAVVTAARPQGQGLRDGNQSNQANMPSAGTVVTTVAKAEKSDAGTPASKPGKDSQQQPKGEGQQDRKQSSSGDVSSGGGASAAKRKSLERCLKCSGCTASNCGHCLPCKDMRQFGGPGKLKKACLKRQCVMRDDDMAATTRE